MTPWKLALNNLEGVTYESKNYEKCPYCGKLFIKERSTQVYCATECGAAVRKNKTILRNLGASHAI